MQVSPDIFEQIVSSIAANSADEQRKHVRIQVKAMAKLLPLRDDERQLGAPEPARVSDFSVGGVGLMYGTDLPAGTMFALQMASETNGPAVTALCEVRHCHAVEGGAFVIGAQFVCAVPRPASELTPADIDLFWSHRKK